MTIYKKFNTNNAIISGVHCYALALKLISSIGHIGIIDIISEGVIDLCEGECIQMNQRFNFDLTTDDYWTIIRKKQPHYLKQLANAQEHSSTSVKKTSTIYRHLERLLA